MIRMLGYVVTAIVAVASTTTLIAKQYVDYTPKKGVWQITAMEVDPNHIDDYLTGLRRTQVPAFEIMKKRGMIDDYKYLVRFGYTKASPTVLIMTHYTTLDAMEPNKARDEAIEKEVIAGLPEAEAKTMVTGYEKYRTFIDDANFGEITFAK